jgi:hypothetical protein
MPVRPIKKSRRLSGRAGNLDDRQSSASLSAADSTTILNRVSSHYHRCFLEDPRAMEYLKQRGIHNNALFTDYRIGFSNGTLLNMVHQAGEVRETLQALGILDENGAERLYSCVVFPLFDETGDCVGLEGWTIGDSNPVPVRLAGGARGVFNYQAAKRTDKIVLVRSIMDALALLSAGISDVLPCHGQEGFTDEHLALFKKHCVREVFVCFSKEEREQQEATRIVKRLSEAGILARNILLPVSAGDTGHPEVHQFFLNERDALAIFRRLLQGGDLGGAATTRVSTAQLPHHDRTDTGFILQSSDRRYEVIGLVKEGVRLKATIKAAMARTGPGRETAASKDAAWKMPFHIDTVDLHSHKSRLAFARASASLFQTTAEAVLDDLAKVLLVADGWRTEETRKEAFAAMTEQERAEALAFLKSPDLFGLIQSDTEALGITGENANKLMCYLAASSRKLDDPISVLIQSRSAAGKSTLQDAVLSLMPSEDCIKYTRLTDQALFYKDEDSLVHKLLAIEEEQGAREASYSIRNIQSSNSLSIATTGKDAATGRLRTEEYRVKGPVAIMLTTTEVELDYETANRFIVLTIDESAEMTERILEKQRERETLEGAIRKAGAGRIIRRHQNAQRLLKPVLVVNPYAPHLTYPCRSLRARRDQKKYLGLIKAIAFLHQYQREVKSMAQADATVRYLEVSVDDIEKANRLAAETLGRSLDELSPPSRRLLEEIHRMVESACRTRHIQPREFHFTRKDVREHAAWSDYQVKCHIRQLEDLEYLFSVKGQRGREYVYELLYTGGGEDGLPFLMGLTSIEQLRAKVGSLEGTGRAVGGRQEGQREPNNPREMNRIDVSPDLRAVQRTTPTVGEEHI